MGGHLAKVETSPAGVTWGIGNDNTPWVYTGSFGGGFFKGNVIKVQICTLLNVKSCAFLNNRVSSVAGGVGC